MSQIKDIEIALRDGLIAELTATCERDIEVLKASLRHIRLSEQMIDQWRETALQYRDIAMEMVRAYDEQSYELERLKAKDGQ
jgi:hypothetical protein